MKLAEIDSLAKDIDERLKGIPAELEERRNAVRKIEDLVQKQHAGITEAEKLFASQELDIATRNDGLSKSKAKGAKARTMREAEAAERELEAVRRSIKDGETERDKLKERIEKTRAGLAEPEAMLETQKTQLASAEVAAESQLAALRIEREKALVGRSESAAKIKKDYLKVYDRLRTKLTPAVAEISDAICQSCRLAMPANRYLVLLKGNEFMQCQSCMRILYHKSLIQD